MENRELILKDYFELKNILNRANKLKNEVNALVFVSEFEAGTGRVFAKTDNARLLISIIKPARKWEEDGLAFVPRLKKYIVDVLNQNLQIDSSPLDCDALIKRSIHELLNYHSIDF